MRIIVADGLSSLIKKDVPIDLTLEQCRWKGYNREKVINLFKDLGFLSLIERLP